MWEGTLTVAGRTYDVTPDRWKGVRDRSWGVRPVGEREAPGIRSRQSRDGYGFRHDWIPMQFDDHMVKVQVDQDTHGHRHVEESMRVWNSDLGRDLEHLGRPEIAITYRSGTREMAQAVVTVAQPDGTDLVVTNTPLRTLYLAAGSGYVPDADWGHGVYQGELVVQGLVHDLTDPEVRRRYAILDGSVASRPTPVSWATACTRTCSRGSTTRAASTPRRRWPREHHRLLVLPHVRRPLRPSGPSSRARPTASGSAMRSSSPRVGVNVVLVSRRHNTLDEATALVEARHPGVQTRVCVADLTSADIAATVAAATDDLDVGAVVYNAGAVHGAGLFTSAPSTTRCSSSSSTAAAPCSSRTTSPRRFVTHGSGAIVLMSSMATLGQCVRRRVLGDQGLRHQPRRGPAR